MHSEAELTTVNVSDAPMVVKVARGPQQNNGYKITEKATICSLQPTHLKVSKDRIVLPSRGRQAGWPWLWTLQLLCVSLAPLPSAGCYPTGKETLGSDNCLIIPGDNNTRLTSRAFPQNYGQRQTEPITGSKPCVAVLIRLYCCQDPLSRLRLGYRPQAPHAQFHREKKSYEA